MEVNAEGTLKNAIVSAATEHYRGEPISAFGGELNYFLANESTGFLVANLIMPDGTPAQAHLMITHNPDQFIGGESDIPQIIIERKGTTHELD